MLYRRCGTRHLAMACATAWVRARSVAPCHLRHTNLERMCQQEHGN